MPPPKGKGKDTAVEAKKCVETELKKFNGKVNEKCAELDQISADAEPIIKKEQKKLRLPGWISKDGLKLTDNLNLNGDVDFKKMKLKLEINGRF